MSMNLYCFAMESKARAGPRIHCFAKDPAQNRDHPEGDPNKHMRTPQPAKEGVPLGHHEGGPPLDMCIQSAQARRPPPPATNDPDLEALRQYPVQDEDHSQAQEPGGDRETLQEQPLTQHTPVLERIVTPRDAGNIIELNQYKYTNVPVAEKHMANLTSHELAEAIRLYRDEQARAQIEYEQEDDQEESGDS
ncbi:hypothetical protein AgCh_028894 [Apium graveolens]